jgi:endonuclease YncB( thermonuclease family)
MILIKLSAKLKLNNIFLFKIKRIFFVLLFLLFLPTIIFSEESPLKDIEDISLFNNNQTQSLMGYLPKIFRNHKTKIFFSEDNKDKELALVFLIEFSKINSLNYSLIDLPIEIGKEYIKMLNIVSVDSIPDLLEKIEKISVDISRKKVLEFLYQNKTKVSGGAISYPYLDRNKNTQNIYIQYLLLFYPDSNSDKKGKVVVNFYSNNYIKPSLLEADGFEMTTDRSHEKATSLAPFIATVSGKVKKGYLNLYEWDGKPEVVITFPEEVPDLGIKPLSFWERQILEPFNRAKHEVVFFVKKTTNVDLSSINFKKVKEVSKNIFNKIKNIFTKNKPNISASLIDNSPEINIPEDIFEKKKDIYVVKRVIDGDTIELENGNIIRFLGINSPEKGECLYLEAKNTTLSKLEGKEVILEKDSQDKDIYGRFLRYVYIDDLLISDYLVKNGFAKYNSYGNDLILKDTLIESQKIAFDNKLGIWGEECSPEAIISEKEIEIENNKDLILDGSLSKDNNKIVSYKWDIDKLNGFNWDNPDLIGEKISINSSIFNKESNIVTLQVTDNSGNISYSELIVKMLEQPTILITEIQIKGNEASEDFIEIYNDSSRDIDISKYNLRKRTQSGKEYSLATFPENSVIKAKDYYIWSNYDNDFSDLVNFSSISKNNSIALINAEDNIIDQVAWGLGDNPFIEEEPFMEKIGENQTFGRILDKLRYIDSNNNKNDFEIQNPSPRGSNSSLSLESEEIEEEIKINKISSVEKENCSYDGKMTLGRNRIIFNEIAWMGTEESSSNEWIELRNLIDNKLSLNDWQILNKSGNINITFGENNFINDKGLFLLERTDDDSASYVKADYIYTGAIKNSSEELYLFDDKCQLQDVIVSGSSWEEGNNSTKKTMERKDNLGWQTSLNNGGTPRKENSTGFVSFSSVPSQIEEVVVLDEINPIVSISYSTSSSSTLNLYLEWSGSDNGTTSSGIKGYIFRYSKDKSSWIYPLGENATTTNSYDFEGTDSNYYFQVKSVDNSGNESNWEEISYDFNLEKTIVINEIAWMGTNSNNFDEWIELYNNSASSTDLLGWKIGSNGNFEIEFTESLVIEGNGYLLLERTDDNTISDISADYIYTGGLTDTGLDLMVYNDQNNLIDKVSCEKNSNNNCKGWLSGDKDNNLSMERISSTQDGSDTNNWSNNNIVSINGKDSDGGRVFGSPGQINSVSKIETVVETLPFSDFSEITLIERGAPYIFNSVFTVPDFATLSIDPGVVVSFKGAGYTNKVGGGLNIDGKLEISGTPDNMAKLTSSNGSDGYWCGIRLNSATTSRMSGVLIEKAGGCGGTYSTGYYSNQSDQHFVINVVDSSVYIKDSLFENNKDLMGVRSYNSSTTIENTEFKGFNDEDSSTAIYSRLGTLNLLNNIFDNNSYGLYSEVYAFNDIQGNRFTNNKYPVYINSSYFSNLNNSVENNTTNGITVRGYISGVGINNTINKGIPIVIDGFAFVRENSKLSLNEGAIIKFKSKAYLDIFGELNVSGSSNNRVVFTSIYDDLNELGSNYYSDTNNDGDSTGSPGNWEYIRVKTGATSTLDNIIVRNGGRTKLNRRGAIWSEGTLSLSNSLLENNVISGVMLSENSITSISDTIFRNNVNDYPSSLGSSGLLIEYGVDPGTLSNLTIDSNYYGLRWIGNSDCSSLEADSRFVFNNNTQDVICY